jgi:hypothetical protein
VFAHDRFEEEQLGRTELDGEGSAHGYRYTGYTRRSLTDPHKRIRANGLRAPPPAPGNRICDGTRHRLAEIAVSRPELPQSPGSTCGLAPCRSP